MGTCVNCNECGCRLSGRAVVIIYENKNLCEDCFKEEVWKLGADRIAGMMLLDIAEADEFLPEESWC